MKVQPSFTNASPRFVQAQSKDNHYRVNPSLKTDTFARTGSLPHPYLEQATRNLEAYKKGLDDIIDPTWCEFEAEKLERFMKSLKSSDPVLVLYEKYKQAPPFSGEQDCVTEQIKVLYPEELEGIFSDKNAYHLMGLEDMEINPSFLEIPHPDSTSFKQGREGLNTTRSFSGEATHLENGNLKLDLSETDNLFHNLSFKKILPDTSVVTEVTEKNIKGETDTYFLRTGVKNKDGNYEVHIYCSEDDLNQENPAQVFTHGENQNAFLPFARGVRKPVLAFRNFPANQALRLNVRFQGKYFVCYPETPVTQTEASQHISWQVTTTDSHLVTVNDKKYPYLFWDGHLNQDLYQSLSKSMTVGHCVPAENSLAFLEEQCEKVGLDPTTTADFITFWTPYLKASPYNIIRFLTPQDCNAIASVDVESETPHALYRFYMAYTPVDSNVSLIEPEALPWHVLANEPHIIDWGGFELAV
jgi:hypothetical protein